MQLVRRVFWSDVGSSPKIESSDLLGSDRKALVWQGLATPTALSVDQSLQRLFWTDQSKHTIESSDFNGGNRRVLYFSEDSQFGGLQVFAVLVAVYCITCYTSYYIMFLVSSENTF